MDSKDARRETRFGPSSPNAQSPKVSTASGMHTHTSSHSEAWAAAPEEVLASVKMAGVRGEVTVISKAVLITD